MDLNLVETRTNTKETDAEPDAKRSRLNLADCCDFEGEGKPCHTEKGHDLEDQGDFCYAVGVVGSHSEGKPHEGIKTKISQGLAS